MSSSPANDRGFKNEFERSTTGLLPRRGLMSVSPVAPKSKYAGDVWSLAGGEVEGSLRIACRARVRVWSWLCADLLQKFNPSCRGYNFVLLLFSAAGE